MAKSVCPKHGSSLHYHACDHVRESCKAGGPLPDLGRNATNLVCRECLTDEVRELLVDLGNLDSSEESIDRFFKAIEALRLKIGFWPLCTDCLYEKTGLDLRRRPLRTPI